MITPLLLRLGHRPIFCTFIVSMMLTIAKSYPTLMDPAISLALMPLFSHNLQGMRFLFLIENGLLYTLVLGPIFHYLWLYKSSSNSNFYYAVTLAYNLFQIMLMVGHRHGSLIVSA